MTIQNLVLGSSGRIKRHETSAWAETVLAGKDPEIERMLESLVQSRFQDRNHVRVKLPAPVHVHFDVVLGLPSAVHEVWSLAADLEDRFFGFYMPDERGVPFTVSIVLGRAEAGSFEEKADRRALEFMAVLAAHMCGNEPNSEQEQATVDALWDQRPFVATTLFQRGLVGPNALGVSCAASFFHDVIGAAMAHRLETGRCMWP